MAPIILDITQTIRQAIDLLDGLPDELFTRVEPPSYTSSIGAHLRHNIDHYHSFCRGYSAGRIDYDHRNRDPRLERELSLSKAVLEGVVADLSTLEEDDLEREVQVKMDCGHHAQWSRSSIRRELQFLLSHTVHHYAVIAVICRTQGHDLPQDLGVAPSTLKYRQAQEKTACAP